MSFEVISLCHTIFNDAFRTYPDSTEEKLKEQNSAKFIIRYLIEIGGMNRNLIAVTSEQVMEGLEYTLPNQGTGGYSAQIILALKNLILTFDGVVKDLSESVTIISDILSTKIEDVKLISNMPKKKKDAIFFYQKYQTTSRRIREEDLPFKILNACDIEEHLRREDPKTCEEIDKRLEED